MSSILFLDRSDNFRDRSISYVISDVQDKSHEINGYKFTDRLGRTEQDKVFLDKFESLFFSAEYNDLKGCKEAVEGLRDINAQYVSNRDVKFKNADTPLHRAARNGNREIIKFLLSKGADLYKKNQEGKTSVDFMSPALLELLTEKTPTTNAVMNVEDLSYYNLALETFKSMPYEEVIDNAIPEAIMSSYSIEECIEKDLASLLENMNKDQLLFFLKQRCEASFTCSKRSETMNRTSIKALIDFLEGNNI